MGVILKELDTKKLLSIALPVSVQCLIQSFLGMIDQMMIGQLGENIVAAVSLGGRPGFILIYTLSGITAAASIFASQYEGAGDKSRHAQVMRSTIFGCLFITLPFLLSAIFIPEILLKAFTTDTAVISAGTGYLKICSLSYIPLIFIMACSAILRSTGEANLPMITGIVAVAVNTMLNTILIFGMFGVPALGAVGAAIATVISQILSATLILIKLLKNQGLFSFNPKNIAFSWKTFGKMVVVGLPAGVQSCAFNVSNAFLQSGVNSFGNDAIAGSTAVATIESLLWVTLNSFINAATTFVSQNVGANRIDRARKSCI